MSMNRDDIIRMADEAGLNESGAVGLIGLDAFIERFAALVAAVEREACAKVAEAYEPRCDTCPSGVANAIRARGQA
jgi:hypothetical protein